MTETQIIAKENWEPKRQTNKRRIHACLVKHGPLACFEIERKAEFANKSAAHEIVSGELSHMRKRMMIGYIWVDCPKDPENFEVIMTRTNPETGNPCEVHRALPEIGWRENEKVVPSPECLDQDYAVIMGLMTEWKGGGKKPSDALRERINKAIADNRAWMANHRGIGSRRRKVKSDDDAVD